MCGSVLSFWVIGTRKIFDGCLVDSTCGEKVGGKVCATAISWEFFIMLGRVLSRWNQEKEDDAVFTGRPGPNSMGRAHTSWRWFFIYFLIKYRAPSENFKMMNWWNELILDEFILRRILIDLSLGFTSSWNLPVGNLALFSR